MPSKSHFFKSKYLKADVDLVNGALTLTIHGVREELIGSTEKELKAIVEFDETPKALVLNMTNYDAIAEICADEETNRWKGHQITLFRSSAMFGGKRVAAIRVRAPKSAAAAPPPPARADDGDMIPEWEDDEEESA